MSFSLLSLGLAQALSTVSMHSQNTARSPSDIAGEIASTTPGERGTPAWFSWVDFDGDGRLDLAAVSPDGRLQLLVDAGAGRFEDVTERLGLTGIANAALPVWGDYDGDRRLDLFVGARAGASRLFHNEGGTFADASAGSGLAVEGAVLAAHWLDEDGDGRLDLHVATTGGHWLFRGLPGGGFEANELPIAPPIAPLGRAERAVGTSLDPAGTETAAAEDGLASAGPGRTSARVAPLPTGTSAGSGIPLTIDPPTLLAFPLACAASIRNQAKPSQCLQASSTPTLGMLFPISSELFVADPSGNVGIGTTSPTSRLHVAGTARVTDTLTLAPAGDQALNVASGNIYKAGALFLHTRGGPNNVALGGLALSNVSTGAFNAALGAYALRSDTLGSYNTAVGVHSLFSNTTGNGNTAAGYGALFSNTSGRYDTACGWAALAANSTGDANAALGTSALARNTSGSSNTATGYQALYRNTTGNGNTAVGHEALTANTTGGYNTASGRRALGSNTIGLYNTAVGFVSLFQNTSGTSNTAVGYAALTNNTTGTGNVALGRYAGSNLTTGSNNIDLGHSGFAAESNTIRIGTPGTQTRTFVAGVRGAITVVPNAIPVLIDSAGQLGTVSSSARFKEEIRDMGELTDRLLKLRPVVFRYRPEVQAGERPLEYGLIAEEVAEVFPELVVYGDDGQPFTVKYHLLSAMLLNELEKQHERVEAQEARSSELERRLAALEARAANSDVAENAAAPR